MMGPASRAAANARAKGGVEALQRRRLCSEGHKRDESKRKGDGDEEARDWRSPASKGMARRCGTFDREGSRTGKERDEMSLLDGAKV